MKTFFLITILIISSSCKESKHNKVLLGNTIINIKDTLNLQQTNIISIKQKNSYPSSLKDTSVCKNWNLSKSDLVKIFKVSKKINNSEWDYLFDHLPCEYIGKLNYKNHEYIFKINGGSWFEVKYRDSIIRYGCSDSDCEKYFISSPIKPEE